MIAAVRERVFVSVLPLRQNNKLHLYCNLITINSSNFCAYPHFLDKTDKIKVQQNAVPTDYIVKKSNFNISLSHKKWNFQTHRTAALKGLYNCRDKWHKLSFLEILCFLVANVFVASKPSMWYLLSVPSLWYLLSVPSLWYLLSVPSLWYFLSVEVPSC